MPDTVETTIATYTAAHHGVFPTFAARVDAIWAEAAAHIDRYQTQIAEALDDFRLDEAKKLRTEMRPHWAVKDWTHTARNVLADAA
ncbi:hypothetical protein [Amycolatopsis sp. DSM 110486]|uniref:hypothetical protein n=1 Tax=Amycolatopsis sp. DSM 110486 TaxID=2865832 RepID=UPI001C6A704F|nr:hypothetical protein [Amycolatopsis sp. DSM 110486]QYN17516.1 hypothetical protein K1T34_32540 [Amycolatopsis sp. DSM 110486]